MNAIGIALVWCVLQVTLACSAGAAVYLVARKTGWAAGRVTTIVTLTIVLAISAAALSPWPSWLSSATIESDTVAAIGELSTEQFSLQKRDRSNLGADSKTTEWSTPPESSGPLNRAFWRSVWAELHHTQPTADKTGASASSAWRWSAMVACVFLVTAAAGLLRLLIAWLAVRRLDRHSTTINDSPLMQLVATFSHELSLSRPVVLKESSELQTAATFGWRRPVLLLPAAWRDWPREELRAVLAHELAHVARGDFAKWLLAQMAVAMHFYHPLVHWLAGRLRLEQELAADATAAQFAGGRETYLQSLATLTLRADLVRPGWAAQTFLPTRSMFVRRIEMLKRTNTMTEEKLSGKARFAVIGALMAIGLLAIGLRAPYGTAPQLIAAEPPATDNTTEGYDFAYVPEKVLGLLTIRPAEMASSPQLAPLAEFLGENMRPSIPFDVLQQVTLVMPMPTFTEQRHMIPGTGGEYTIFRTNRAVDFMKKIEASYGAIKTEQRQSQEYWTWDSSPGRIAFHSPDEKTLLSRAQPGLFDVMDHPKAAHPPTQDATWRAAATGPIFGVANVKAYREMQTNPNTWKLPDGFMFQMFAPFFNIVESVTFTVDGEVQLVLKAQAVCTSPEKVAAVERTVQSALVLLDNSIASQLQALKDQPGDDIGATRELLSLLSDIIKNTNLASEGNYLRLTAPLGDIRSILQTALPKIQAARMAANRVQSKNNLKNVALAFLNYASEHDHHFPPAVLYDKETGTPYSWRVAILPYLDQKNVYDQYHFDEPWDSEQNRRVLAYRPRQLLSPTKPISTNAAYYVLTGPETGFPEGEGLGLMQFTDGTSNTILVVEAKRDIPWTKPEDIPYSSNKPLPKLGGVFKGGFHTAICDGSVLFLPEMVDQQTLRHLIEKADGNVVKYSEFKK